MRQNLRLHASLTILLVTHFVFQSTTFAQVRLVEKNGRFGLLRNGNDYAIRGVGGTKNLETLAELGGNSIRTWGTDGLGTILDNAHRHGLTVCVGLWLEHERHGFNYEDKAAVEQQFQNCMKVVRQFKDHPAVLLWGIGNEMEGDGNKQSIWQAINRIAAQIKTIDPNHPTMTVISELGTGESKLRNIDKFCPDIDIVGVNSYGGITTLAKRYRKSRVLKPYIITEHGPRGPWEVEKTPWGSAIEESSTRKARFYKQGYEGTVIRQKNLCLGSNAFLWGHKQETTATWFGMFLQDGSKLESVDTMSKLWTGKAVKNRCPRIKEIRLNKSVGLSPGEIVNAIVYADDPEKDKLRIIWKLRRDSGTIGVGGDFQEPIDDIEGSISSKGRKAQVKIPSDGGTFRLFAYVYDRRGGAAVHNVCLNAAKN